VRHRLRRLPDTPERIARGIWAGVFVTFTPFYGLHFICAAMIARLMSGNLLASLLGTFFGNPLTYIPIGVVSLKTGHHLLGTEFEHGSGVHDPGFIEKFVWAADDLQENIMALFRGHEMDWSSLATFYDEVFFPYLVGGIIPGVFVATFAYFLTVPIIHAYQKRRRGVFKARAALRRKNKS
jgi:uncharacterized protein (DUF2062 family)